MCACHTHRESHGLPGKIHISGAAYQRIVDKHKYAVRERGNIAVKGRGKMTVGVSCTKANAG